MKKGKIYGVSLGPGDPELITLKGLTILKKADKIFYPGSRDKEGRTTSISKEILDCFELDQDKLCGIFLTMSDEREINEVLYDAYFLKIKDAYDAGKQVVFVSEGDITFYSTFSYLLSRFHKHQLEVEIVAGIPSFLLGTALHQVPLAILRERVAILPRVKDLAEVLNCLDTFETLVLIKVHRVIKELLVLEKSEQLRLLYCERLGMKNQFISSNITELANREIPYFSLVIVQKNNLTHYTKSEI